MPLEQHPLSREFPDFHAELKQLHGNDAHFTRLAADYESLDKRIYEVEGGRSCRTEASSWQRRPLHSPGGGL